MELFVLRHGHAEMNAPTDAQRRLSSAGEKEVQITVQKNSDVLSHVQHVYVSPFIRAQQSADIVVPTLAGATRSTCDLITPSGRPQDVIDFLFQETQNQGYTSLMLVSHLPFVGMLIDTLCDLENGEIHMGTASLAAIDFDVMAARCCHLRWIDHVVG